MTCSSAWIPRFLSFTVTLGLILNVSLPLRAETISWVNWTPSTSPGTTSTGTGSGLTVDANWTRRTDIQFQNRSINLTDPAWTYDNDDVVHMWLAQAGTVPYNGVIIDFTNVGGLAAGGSIGFVDIDSSSTFFEITAYVDDGDGGFDVQDVDWAFNTYRNVATDGRPTWDPATNTIRGNGGGNDVFAFLTSNVQVDRVRLDGQTVNDGWGFAATNISVVPEPTSLLFIGLAGVVVATTFGRSCTRKLRRKTS